MKRKNLIVVLFVTALVFGTAVLTRFSANAAPGDSISAISSGRTHTLAIQSDGSLWAWGANGSGQLGIGSNEDSLTPRRVETDNNWIAVSAGSIHSLAIKSDGSLWAWGANGSGQLGIGNDNVELEYSPKQVGTDNNWVTVSAGQDYSLAIKSDGSLWAWGANGSGQLGIGNNTTTADNPPIEIGAGYDWVTVSAGDSHTLAIKSDGSLWAWGNNYYGQLGDGTTTDDNTPIRVGTDNNWVTVSVGSSHTAAIQSDGSLWVWGYSLDTRPVQFGSGNDWVAVSAGNNYTIALRLDGSLWAWGENGSGQLGNGTTTDSNTPIRVGTGYDAISAGSHHTVAIQSDGSLLAWGHNGNGRLGNGTTTNSSTPTLIPAVGGGSWGGGGTPVVVTSITIRPDEAVVPKGEEYQFNVWAGVRNLNRDVNWRADSELSEIDESGKLLVHENEITGTQIVITATLKDDNSKSDTATITVADADEGGDGGFSEIGDVTIKITKPPDRTVYVIGDSLALSGIEVTAEYSNAQPPKPPEKFYYSDYSSVYSTVPENSSLLREVGRPFITVSVSYDYNEDSNITDGENAQFNIIVGERDGDYIKITLPDGIVIHLTDGASIDESSAITLPPGSVITFPDGTEIQLPNGAYIYENGAITLLPGSIIKFPDGTVIQLTDGASIDKNGTIILLPGSVITLPDGILIQLPNGASIDENGTIILPPGSVITFPDGIVIQLTDEASIDENGTIILPSDSVITLPDGTEIQLPNGASIDKNGMITLPSGSIITLPDGTVIQLPNGASIDENGTIILPPGSVITFPDGTEIQLPNGASIDENGTITLPPGSIITLPDGTEIQLPYETEIRFPYETSIDENGMITLPSDSIITFPDGTVIQLPDGASIDENGAITLPPGGTAVIETSDGSAAVRIEAAGDIKIEQDGTITLPPGSIITTANGTGIILHSGGSIIEGGETFDIDAWLSGESIEIPAETIPRCLFIYVEMPGGADVVYPGNSPETEIVPGDSVIKVNPDGSVEPLLNNLVEVIEKALPLTVQQYRRSGSYYFDPADLPGYNPEYRYEITERPQGTLGGTAPIINKKGQFTFAGHVMPANVSRAGNYEIRAYAGKLLKAIYEISVETVN